MRRRFSLTAVCFLAVLASIVFVPVASAQGVYVTPIPNAPFTGMVNVERSFVRPDGSVSQLKTMHNIGRDSKGRIFNEARVLLPVSSPDAPQLLRIHLYDPQTRISTMLNVHDRTFWTSTVNRPPQTVPPALLYASPTGNSLPQSDFSHEEDLGNREIEGLSVHGVRETQTITEENTGKETVITDEYWYSADLRINMVIKHNDPSKGSVTLAVSHISRAEPSASLFEVPEGYKPAGAAKQ